MPRLELLSAIPSRLNSAARHQVHDRTKHARSTWGSGIVHLVSRTSLPNFLNKTKVTPAFGLLEKRMMVGTWREAADTRDRTVSTTSASFDGLFSTKLSQGSLIPHHSVASSTAGRTDKSCVARTSLQLNPMLRTDSLLFPRHATRGKARPKVELSVGRTGSGIHSASTRLLPRGLEPGKEK